MPMLDGASFIASGNINPSTMVSISGNFAVAASNGLTDTAIIGISQPGTDYAPGAKGADYFAAQAGETLQVYGPGDVCLLQISTAAVTAGQFLGPDANALGTALTGGSSAQYYGCKTLEAANPGEFCRVLVLLGAITAT